MAIHFNSEYLMGFIEGLISEYDLGIGPFKVFLDGYHIEIKLNYEDEKKPVKVKIHYSIKSTNDAWVSEFNLYRNASIEDFRSLMAQACEQIMGTIKELRNDQLC